jgi:hypothetical protein
MPRCLLIALALLCAAIACGDSSEGLSRESSCATLKAAVHVFNASADRSADRAAFLQVTEHVAKTTSDSGLKDVAERYATLIRQINLGKSTQVNPGQPLQDKLQAICGGKVG